MALEQIVLEKIWFHCYLKALLAPMRRVKSSIFIAPEENLLPLFVVPILNLMYFNKATEIAQCAVPIAVGYSHIWTMASVTEDPID